MGRIIDFGAAKAKKNNTANTPACEHKHATVYAAERKVYCSACGAPLDPFDVLLDLVQRTPWRASSRKRLNEVEKFEREWQRRLHAVERKNAGNAQPE